MKKYFTFLISIALLTLMSLWYTACVRKEVQSQRLATSGQSQISTQTYRIAYIARAQADSFAAWLANSIEEEVDKYENLTVDVFDSQADDSKENAFIENAVANKYDLIIVQPNNGEAQRPYIENAIAKNVPVIITNPRIEGILGANTVDANPYEQAAVNARKAREQIPQNAKVVVLNGPAGNMHADVRREAWQIEFFDKRSDIEIVGEQIAHWNKDEAIRYMEDWIQIHPDIQAIISMNDNMVAGALEVIKDKPEYRNMYAYGVDGTAEAALLIQEGRLSSTSLQNAYVLAEMNVRAAYDLLTGKLQSVHEDIGCPLIDSTNVADLVAIHQKAGSL